MRRVVCKLKGTARLLCAGTLVLSCGGRASLYGGQEEAEGAVEPSSGGLSSGGAVSGGASSGGAGSGGVSTGGSNSTGGSCQDALDLNSGSGDWQRQLRIEPVAGDLYSASLPSLALSNENVSLAFTVARVDVPELGDFTPGLIFSQSNTPLVTGASPPHFSLELVDPAAIAGGALAANESGLFISYQTSDGLSLASRTSGDWSLELVEPIDSLGDFVWTSQTAVDKNGAVHIVYSADSTLRYAKKESGIWTFEWIAPLAETPQSLDLELDEEGTPHVIWVESIDEEPVLWYATRQAQWFTEEVLVPVLAHDASLALSPDGTPHVAFITRYLRESPTFLGRRNAGGWEHEEVDVIPDPSGFRHISLDLDRDGFAHLFIAEFPVSTYATNRSGSWQSQDVPLTAEDGVDFVVDDSGAAHIVARYFNYPNNVAPEYLTNRVLAPDGLDQNCDGVDGIDSDGDGSASLWTGGNDCDDSDPLVAACEAPE